MKFSVIVPTYNSEETLTHLLNSLASQSFKDFEVIVVDDCSQDNTRRAVRSFACQYFRSAQNRGPAFCRNLGAAKARGEILVFIDSDCVADRRWLENIEKHFIEKDVAAIMGRLVLMPSTFLGDSISALGFPAGGAIGFDKIWKVDPEGFTDSLSSCNCAIKKDIFNVIQGFDTSFPYPGGEDSLLAYHLRKHHFRIKYCPDVLAFHKARDAFKGFLKWQFRRGISSFLFSTKISDKKRFVSLRMWSSVNIIRTYYRDKKFPLIVCLLMTSFLTQFIGFMYGKHSRGAFAGTHH